MEARDEDAGNDCALRARSRASLHFCQPPLVTGFPIPGAAEDPPTISVWERLKARCSSTLAACSGPRSLRRTRTLPQTVPSGGGSRSGWNDWCLKPAKSALPSSLPRTRGCGVAARELFVPQACPCGLEALATIRTERTTRTQMYSGVLVTQREASSASPTTVVVAHLLPNAMVFDEVESLAEAICCFDAARAACWALWSLLPSSLAYIDAR